MSKAQVTDIVLLAFISGVVAILTSMMGISGTIIGAVVTSLIAESLKAYFKEPIKDRINDYEQQSRSSQGMNNSHSFETYEYIDTPSHNKMPRPRTTNRTRTKRYQQRTNESDGSFLTAKILFIFPLVVILIIELIHFLGAINIIPYDIFYSLESITKWTLFRNIGYALIVMGIFPLVSKKFRSSSGIILIIFGIIDLIFGYADISMNAMMLTSFISSLREYVNIGIILAILYTILTIHEEGTTEKEVQHYY